METISSRENSNFMPVAGLIAGVVALLLAGIALVKASSAQKELALQADKVAKIDGIESQVSSVSSSLDGAKGDIRKLTTQTQDAVNQIGTMIGDLRTEVTKIAEASKKPAAAVKGAKGEKGEAPVAGPGEYLVKKGDSGMKIAKANGVSLADLQAVNPSINWNKMHEGQKIKLPAKK